jgi:hypothetical protein
MVEIVGDKSRDWHLARKSHSRRTLLILKLATIRVAAFSSLSSSQSPPQQRQDEDDNEQPMHVFDDVSVSPSLSFFGSCDLPEVPVWRTSTVRVI